MFASWGGGPATNSARTRARSGAPASRWCIRPAVAVAVTAPLSAVVVYRTARPSLRWASTPRHCSRRRVVTAVLWAGDGSIPAATSAAFTPHAPARPQPGTRPAPEFPPPVEHRTAHTFPPPFSSASDRDMSCRRSGCTPDRWSRMAHQEVSVCQPLRTRHWWTPGGVDFYARCQAPRVTASPFESMHHPPTSWWYSQIGRCHFSRPPGTAPVGLPGVPRGAGADQSSCVATRAPVHCCSPRPAGRSVSRQLRWSPAPGERRAVASESPVHARGCRQSRPSELGRLNAGRCEAVPHRVSPRHPGRLAGSGHPVGRAAGSSRRRPVSSARASAVWVISVCAAASRAT